MTDTTNIRNAINGLPDDERLYYQAPLSYMATDITTDDLKALVADYESLKEQVDGLTKILDSAEEINLGNDKRLKFVPTCGWTTFEYDRGEYQNKDGAVFWSKRKDYPTAIEAFQALSQHGGNDD